MPSSPSSRLLLELQAPGENLNTWGEKLNNLFQMLEAAIRGRQALAVSGPVSLASAKFALSPDTPIWLDLSGTGGTLTLPARESLRIVRNAGSGDMTLTTGAGEAAVIEPGALTLMVCDGINVRQLGFGGGSLKAYIDQELLAASAGELPGQAGNAGKYLTTNGTNASWDGVSVGVASLTDFPSQADNAGRVLSTDGAALSWLAVATTAEILGAAARIVTAERLFDAAQSVALTDAATLVPDGAAGWNFHVTLGGNRALGAPANFRPGQSGRLRIVQPPSGGPRTLGFDPVWKFPGGVDPTLSTAAGAVDVLAYYVHDATNIECGFMKGMA
jgi:hypothetical protein